MPFFSSASQAAVGRSSIEKSDADSEAYILPPSPAYSPRIPAPAYFLGECKHTRANNTSDRVLPPPYSDVEALKRQRTPVNCRQTHIKGAIYTAIITVVVLAAVLGFV